MRWSFCPRAPRASGTSSRTASRTWASSPPRFAAWVREGRLDPAIVSQLVGRRRRDDPIDHLTPREREVLEHMAQGRSNQGIADQLVVTERAVEKHVTSIFGKLRLPHAPEDHRRCYAAHLPAPVDAEPRPARVRFSAPMEAGWPHSRLWRGGRVRREAIVLIGAVVFGILLLAVGGWTVRGVRWAVTG